MKKKLRRAFTITELVIVIAVIAILAAVLIPTFVNVTRKAKESADTQTVANINKILTAEQTINRRPAANIGEALAQVEEGGYMVEKLTPTSEGNDILWDQVSNRFLLVSQDGMEVLFKDDLTAAPTTDTAAQYWVISGELHENYSTRLTKEYTGSKITTTKGVDVSEVENLVDVTIAEPTATNTAASVAKTKLLSANLAEGTTAIKVTMNGGTLTVDLESATVAHYGTSKNATITSGNYTLYGTVSAYLTVESSEGAISVAAGASVNVIVNTVKNNNIEISASATVDATVYEPLSEDAENFDGGIGTEAAPYLIATAEQLAKIVGKGTEQTRVYFALTNDVKPTSGLLFDTGCNIDLDLNNKILSAEEMNASSSSVIQLGTNRDAYRSLKIHDGSIQARDIGAIYVIGDAAQLTIDNCVLDSNGGTGFCIATNGNTENVQITITNTTIDKSTTSYAVYLPSSGTYRFINNTVKGYVVIRGGTTEIEGGTYYSRFGGFGKSYSSLSEKIEYIEGAKGGAGCIGAAITVIRSGGYNFESCTIKNITIAFLYNKKLGYKYSVANAIEVYDLNASDTMNVTIEGVKCEAKSSTTGKAMMYTKTTETELSGISVS